MYLDILKSHLKNYKDWLNDLDMNLKSIETSILQNDKRNILLEKFTSYGLSAILLTTVSGFFTGGTSLVAMIGGGILGLVSSKLTFNHLFGKIKTEKDLIESELLVIKKIIDLQSLVDEEKLKILKKNHIYFDYYSEKKEFFNDLNYALKNMDNSNLSRLYKVKFNNAIIEYDRNIFHFNDVYTETT